MPLPATLGAAATKASASLVSTELAKHASTGLFDAWKEWKKVHEVEKTKRESIRAQRDVAIERIRAEREVLQYYLEQTFAERRAVIAGMFEALDQGLKSDNLAIAERAMQSIVDTVRTSPLAEVKNLLTQNADPNVKEVWI
ncbi:MAG: hypothetical protein IJ228_08040 [Succinivibrio sp.]|nr:hypothetical protein [Succinivibrio sp.]